MASLHTVLYAFNRGLVSRLALAREDIKRLAMSADIYFTNYMPRVMGSMMLRPGLKFLGAIYSYLHTRFIPFIFSVTDTALIEITSTVMRVWVNDALITRVAVATTRNTSPE